MKAALRTRPCRRATAGALRPRLLQCAKFNDVGFGLEVVASVGVLSELRQASGPGGDNGDSVCRGDLATRRCVSDHEDRVALMSAFVAKHLSGRGACDDSCWAIASARRDRAIVSSGGLVLVISTRVTDLSADPRGACSRAAGQLTPNRVSRLCALRQSHHDSRAGLQLRRIRSGPPEPLSRGRLSDRCFHAKQKSRDADSSRPRLALGNDCSALVRA